MTSLKAISTLPRKAKVFLVLFLLFSLSLPVYSESFALSVSGGNGSYKTLLLGVLSSFETVGSDKVLTLREERRERETLIKDAKTKTEESRNEKWSEKKEETKSEITSLTLTVTQDDFSLYDEFLSIGDRDANYYIRAVKAVDGLLYIKSEEDGSVEKVDLYFNGDLIHSAWYSSALRESEEEALYSLFSSLFLSEDYSLYKLSVSPSDAAVLVDGSMLESGKRYLILKDGTHTFSLSSYGSKSAVFSFDLDGSASELSLSLEKAEPFTLSLTTYPFDVDIFVNGIRREEKIIDGLYTPFLITLSRENFAEYSYQERTEKNHITLYMAPQWIEDADLINEKKDTFYKSLFYLLLSYGGYTASNAISSYYSSDIGNVSKVVFTGCSVVSLIELVRSAVDYYNSAKLGL